MATYREAGVDIDAGEELVRRIKPAVRTTFTGAVQQDIGAFGGFFELDTSGLKRPVLVSSVDGVGTKLEVAYLAGRHDGVGQDLVNHCINDIAVCGARPLFFLDYYATGKLDVDAAEAVVLGFAKACRAAGVALIGGETAEMPGMYEGSKYDLAGTIVGVVDHDQIITGATVQPGDVLIGLPSTGLHTNGYSLARKVLLNAFTIEDRPSALQGASLADALLAVHRSYLDTIQALLAKRVVQGMAHVTGGGISGNIKRVMPDGMRAAVDYDAWHRPPLFELIQSTGNVPEEDMRRTFNLGIGLILVVRPHDAPETMALLRDRGEDPVSIGHVVEG
jgi:phosphoribosylformylglycinamidine cyclo-ligase